MRLGPLQQGLLGPHAECSKLIVFPHNPEGQPRIVSGSGRSGFEYHRVALRGPSRKVPRENLDRGGGQKRP